MERPRTRPNVTVPRTDDGYFEEMTRAVFQAGIDWGVIRKRWPAFRKAFKGFSAKKVALFSPDDVDYLLSAESGVVRNFKKVSATLHNAAKVVEVREEFGSFRAYLRSMDEMPYAARVKDLKRRFKHVGDTGAFVFLYSVGEDVPSWHDRKVSGKGRATPVRRRSTRRGE